MPISVQSWEFIFVYNIFIAAILPWLLKPLPSKSITSRAWCNRIWFRLLLCLEIPLAAASIACAIKLECDLEFYFLVFFLHCGISFFNLGLLWWLIDTRVNLKRKIGFYYLVLGISAVVSILALVFTPSLAFTDIFWGVIPGTVSLDPIISLPPYYLRAWVSFMVCLMVWKWRSPWTILISGWLAFALIGQFAPSPFLSVRALNRQFKENFSKGPIHIHMEDPKAAEKTSAEIWAKTFDTYLAQLTEKLPPSLKPTDETIQNFRFDIYIYASDDSKNRWIHARQTQIGHFLRGEMHLSHLDIKSEILAHELAHLLHGQLKAQFISYVDPFYFEGFAVALSEASLEKAKDEGAAIAQSLPAKQLLQWPRFFKFFTIYPARAAYALAGANAAQALDQKAAPWEIPLSSIEDLLHRKPSDDELRIAKNIFSRPPLLYDPLRRDCARLEHDYHDEIRMAHGVSEKLRSKIRRLCPSSRVVIEN